MALVRRVRICYSLEEQERFRNYIIDFLRKRYEPNPLVKNIWLTGSITTNDFGVYRKPYKDRYGKTQQGSDVDVMMTLNYSGSMEKLRKDKQLHRKLKIRNKSEDSYAFLDDRRKDLVLKSTQAQTGKPVRHPVYGVVFTAEYFRKLTSGKHDKETIARGQGSWRGIEKKKNVVQVK